MYDLLAGKENMESAYWMGKGKALEAFPMLKGEGLVGGVVYYDGECAADCLTSAHFRSTQRHANGYLARFDRCPARCRHGEPRRGHRAAQEVRREEGCRQDLWRDCP